MNRFYLTPDAFSTVFISHWLISEQQNPINGGIKNEKYDYIHCPYTNWDGWEVDSGHGTWEEDKTLKTTCHIGDEAATTNLPPISTTAGYTCSDFDVIISIISGVGTLGVGRNSTSEDSERFLDRLVSLIS